MTATPPRPDLRTLAAEAIRHGDHALADDGECGRREDQLAVVDAVLAAVLPEHRRMVLGEAADELDAHLRPSPTWTRPMGGAEVVEWLRHLAATAPETTLTAPVPAETAPAVPEEADGQRATESDALTYAEMEAERDRLAGEVFTLTSSEALAVVAAELERDNARADRDRLAAQVRGLVDEHAGCGDECSLGPELGRLLDALPDAGTDQTEDDHG